MTDDGGSIIKGDDNRIRDPTATDLKPSSPSGGKHQLVTTNKPVTKRKKQVPEEVRQRTRERTLAERVRREHSGSGFVILNTENASIVDVVDDLQEARSALASTDLNADNALIVDCHA